MTSRLSGRAGRTVRVLLSFALVLGAFTVAGVRASAPAQAAAANPAGAAIDAGLAALGRPYSWGGDGPDAYDCSGLTQMAYRAAGIAIPRTSREQYRLLPKVPRSQARPGDLAFWASNPADPSTVHHVAMFIGAGMMIDAPNPGSVVQVRRVYATGLMPYVARPGGANAPALLPIKRGDRGGDVRALQRRLRAQGYNVPVTGWYGPMTYAAVRQVQLRTGYSGTGYVGGATWGYLVTHGARLWVS